jgi:hypothetical protein
MTEPSPPPYDVAQKHGCPPPKRLFLSFMSRDREDANRLRRRLEQTRDGWRVDVYPRKRVSPEAWQKGVKGLIEFADAVVCLIGDETAASENVKWEIETALSYEKRVVPVSLGSFPVKSLPAPLRDRRPIVEPTAGSVGHFTVPVGAGRSRRG